MDEPFSALDEPTRYGMQELIVNLWHRVQPTVFVITHSVTEAVYLSERVWIFSHGPGQIVYDIRDCMPPTAGVPPLVAQEKPEFKEAVRIVTETFRKVVDKAEIPESPRSAALLK
jgi:ABC-type nitrate/sulfonate/bicarbonate transport system ATPase subunit